MCPLFLGCITWSGRVPPGLCQDLLKVGTKSSTGSNRLEGVQEFPQLQDIQLHPAIPSIPGDAPQCLAAALPRRKPPSPIIPI